MDYETLEYNKIKIMHQHHLFAQYMYVHDIRLPGRFPCGCLIRTEGTDTDKDVPRKRE